jgi:ribose transport system ATP-binding protein
LSESIGKGKITTKEPSKPHQASVLLNARGICKSFPGVRALDNVQITVRRGSVHALVGENGAGKSTLINILAGVFPPDKGEILLAGHAVNIRNARDAQQAGIATIFQELNLIRNLSSAENIFLGREPLSRLGLIDYRKMHAEAHKLFVKLNVEIDPQTSVERLPVGSQQLVEIARALSLNAQVIIMDEPTSALSEKEIESLFRLIQQLKQHGVGLIYITHKLDELNRIADDVSVLRDGRLVATKSFSEVTHDELVCMMVGRVCPSQIHKAANLDDEMLQVQGISLRHPDRPADYLLRDITFAVRRGEVIGLFGLMGAGRTELLQAIFGLHPQASSGTIRVAGIPRDFRSPRDAMRAGVALAPEDRKTEGLVLTMSVAENASLSCLDRITRWGILQRNRERTFVQTFIDRLGVKTPSLNSQVRNLSGGNQQKVILAKWLATKPTVLLLDEPTRGIDVNAKHEMYAIIEELARNGLAVLFVSSELPEILTVADRILVLVEGRITAEFLRGEATEEIVLKAALPTRTSHTPSSA